MRAFPALAVLTLLMAGCAAEEPAADVPAVDRLTSDAGEEAVWANFTGKVTGTPAAPGQQDFPVEVPKGAVEVQATLTWSQALADLRLELLDPEGAQVESGFKEADGQRSAATLDPPASGTWTVRVVGMRALDEPFEVAARVTLIAPAHNVLEQTYDIGGASLFKEVNVVMEEGATFAWSFEATAPVHYDLHSHEDGETVYHEQGTAESAAGNFTAPKRQIYSVLFAPPDTSAPTPATVRFRMEGAFRVHSHSQ